MRGLRGIAGCYAFACVALAMQVKRAPESVVPEGFYEDPFPLWIPQSMKNRVPMFLHVPHGSPGWASITDEVSISAATLYKKSGQPKDVAFVMVATTEHPRLSRFLDHMSYNYHMVGKDCEPWTWYCKVGPIIELLKSGAIKEKYTLVMDANDVYGWNYMGSDSFVQLPETFEYFNASMVIGSTTQDLPPMPEVKSFEETIYPWDPSHSHARSAYYMARTDQLLRLLEELEVPEDKSDFDDQLSFRMLHFKHYPDVKVDSLSMLFFENEGYFGHPEILNTDHEQQVEALNLAQTRRQLPSLPQWTPKDTKLGKPFFMHVPPIAKSWPQVLRDQERKLNLLAKTDPAPTDVAFIFPSNVNYRTAFQTACDTLGLTYFVIADEVETWTWLAKVEPLIELLKSGKVTQKYTILTDAYDVFPTGSDLSGLVDAFEFYEADMVIGGASTDDPPMIDAATFERSVYPWSTCHVHGQSSYMARTDKLLELLQDVHDASSGMKGRMYRFDDTAALRSLHMKHYPRVKVDTLTKLFVRANEVGCGA